MGKPKRMDQVRFIISAYLETGSIGKTIERTKIARNTVRHYVRKAKAYMDDLGALLCLSDEELYSVFYSKPIKKQQGREDVFISKIEYWLSELKRVGVNKKLLWEEYRKAHPAGYGYSRFCERLVEEAGRKDLTLMLNHVPGEVMQVDFAGKKMSWRHPLTGDYHKCEVLVAVLPYSQQTFVIALDSQRLKDFVDGLNEALLYFGRLPKAILSDNLKSYVSRPDRYEPKFTELCKQLAAHYGLDLRATRVRKPKDKASVENMVSIVYTRIHAPLRNQVFHSRADLNAAIVKQLDLHNNRPFQKREGSRRMIFQRDEFPVMGELPNDIFEIRHIRKAKVQRNYHVQLGSKPAHFYSVPFQYVGKKALIYYTSKIVEIFIGQKRVAVHPTIQSDKPYKYSTKEEHTPSNHRDWKRGYNSAYFRNEADNIGPATLWAIDYVLASRCNKAQTFNACKGILQLGKQVSFQRLEKVCQLCQQAGKAGYRMIKRMLQHNLDQIEAEPDLFNPPTHDNIRGPEAYL